MKNRELLNTIINQQLEMKAQLDMLVSLLSSKYAAEIKPFDLNTVGYVTTSDLARLGAPVRLGKDGREYIWLEKTNVPKVLQNAIKHDMLDEVRESLLFLIERSFKSAERLEDCEFKDIVTEKLTEKRKECQEFDSTSES